MPTDVEVANGHVDVSTLPGGGGGLGSVSTIGRHGSTRRITTGVAAVTDQAASPYGSIHVVELGIGISTPGLHGPRQVADLPGAAAVECANGRPSASTAPAITGGSAPGHIVVLR